MSNPSLLRNYCQNEKKGSSCDNITFSPVVDSLDYHYFLANVTSPLVSSTERRRRSLSSANYCIIKINLVDVPVELDHGIGMK